MCCWSQTPAVSLAILLIKFPSSWVSKILALDYLGTYLEFITRNSFSGEEAGVLFLCISPQSLLLSLPLHHPKPQFVPSGLVCNGFLREISKCNNRPQKCYSHPAVC